jgi:hypothetical protein
MEEEEADKVRFIQPLAQLMMDCKVGREDNTSATDEELMISHVRRATRVVSKAETPTLQRAITTAAEIAEFLASREKPMEISNLEPLVLEHFLHKSQSQVRATNAAKWQQESAAGLAAGQSGGATHQEGISHRDGVQPSSDSRTKHAASIGGEIDSSSRTG